MPYTARPLGSANLNVNLRKNIDFHKFVDDEVLEKIFKPFKSLTISWQHCVNHVRWNSKFTQDIEHQSVKEYRGVETHS